MSKKRLITLIIATFCVNPACGEKSTDPEPFPRTLILDYGAVWSGAHDLIAYIHDHIPGSDDPDSAGIQYKAAFQNRIAFLDVFSLFAYIGSGIDRLEYFNLRGALRVD